MCGNNKNLSVNFTFIKIFLTFLSFPRIQKWFRLKKLNYKNTFMLKMFEKLILKAFLPILEYQRFNKYL